MVFLDVLPCVASLTAARNNTSDDAVDFGRGLAYFLMDMLACFLMDNCDLVSVEASSK